MAFREKKHLDNRRALRNTRQDHERALLAARISGKSREEFDSLRELKNLALTAGADVIDRVTQERVGIVPATYIGSGKVAEVADRVKEENIQVVIFDHELTPSQNRNLEEALNVKVVDRTGLILDIFARHATTREGKLQVELAQLSYHLPRLIGQVSHWSRLAGGIGTMGPGETMLEKERRRLRNRIAWVRRELKKVEGQRDLQRKRRQSIPVPLVSIVGYTNAGKSTLMNQLTSAGVSVEDALFATLDPTVRRVRLPSGRQFLLADTVGFVRKLPHQLVEAFKATLREIGGACLLLHVVDTPQDCVEDQVQTVEKVIEDLGFQDKPTIRVFNKMDVSPKVPMKLFNDTTSVPISALTGQGVKQLLETIDDFLAEDEMKVTMLLPYDAGKILNEIYQCCRVLKKEDNANGILLTAEMSQKFAGKYSDYIKSF